MLIASTLSTVAKREAGEERETGQVPDSLAEDRHVRSPNRLCDMTGFLFFPQLRCPPQAIALGLYPIGRSPALIFASVTSSFPMLLSSHGALQALPHNHLWAPIPSVNQ